MTDMDMNTNAGCLIAAAPDLLAALERLADEFQAAASTGRGLSQDDCLRRAERVRAVIARVKGER